MTPESLVEDIKNEILENNLSEYRKIFTNTSLEDKIIDYWRNALILYSDLKPEQREILFKIIKQTMVDTIATMLASLDGTSFFSNQNSEFSLYESGKEKLNGDLHDIFLEKMEKDSQRI